MKRAFIRALWGQFDRSHAFLEQRFRVEADIKRLLRNSFGEPFTTYVMGKDNLKGLTDLGIKNCRLIHNSPFLFDPINEVHLHKLEAIRYAMEDDGLDEIVYLDWDCYPTQKLSSTFWSDLGKKEKVQIPLIQYHRIKCPWRNDDQRKTPNGGFIYIRDKKIPAMAIQKWKQLNCFANDEIAWAKLTDEMMGGWQGISKYWQLFEPMCCNLGRSSPFVKEMLATKNVQFIHKMGNR